MDKEVYIESLKEVEAMKKGTLNRAIAHAPTNDLWKIAIVWIIAITYLIWTGKVGYNWLWFSIAGIIGIILWKGSQEVSKDLDIAQLQAKAILLFDLWKLKKSQTREFDGLIGTFDTYGPINLDNTNQDKSEWVYEMGWFHRNTDGITKYYVAEVYSKAYKAKVKRLATGVGMYEGEKPISPGGQSSPKNVHIYYPQQQPSPLRF